MAIRFSVNDSHIYAGTHQVVFQVGHVQQSVTAADRLVVQLYVSIHSPDSILLAAE